jgi:hypothetical protein
MTFAPAEQAAVDAHAAALGMTSDEYVYRTAAERALDWQRLRDCFTQRARQRGITVEELVRRGSLTDDVTG